MRAVMLILVLGVLTLAPGPSRGPIPGDCLPPPCSGVLVCSDDSGCDCVCLPGY